MTNIVERLRASPNRYRLCAEAADEIERLRAALSELVRCCEKLGFSGTAIDDARAALKGGEG